MNVRPSRSFHFAVVVPSVLASTMCLSGAMSAESGFFQASSAASAAAAQPGRTTGEPGVPLKADKLNQLLPATVYFQGRTAALQLRNAGGTVFPGGAVVWAALVDTSGYASNVQERYQFYLVTEAPLTIGGSKIAAGAYGAGFLGDRFVVMDLGGHTVAEGSTQVETGLPRPRPLQVLPEAPNAVKLFLGRRWVELRSEGAAR